MLDEQSEQNQERGSQLAVAVGMLLFASVVLGSGVLGDTGDTRLSDAEEGADDADSNPATDREQMANGAMDLRDVDGDLSWEDCLGSERPDAIPGQEIPEDMPRDRQTDPNTATDRPDSPDTPVQVTGTNAVDRITFTVDRADAADEPCSGMFRNAPSMLGMNGMLGPNQGLNSMFHGMCQSWVHSEFWGNIHGDVERAEDGSISITTYDEDRTENTDTLSPNTVRAMTAGLAPLVDGCTGMLSSMMMSSGMGPGNGFGGGMMDHGDDRGHDWFEDCEEDDREDWVNDEWDDEYDWDEEESDEYDESDEVNDDDSDEEEPREPRHADENDRRHGDWNPCADYDREHDWDDEESDEDEDGSESEETDDDREDDSNESATSQEECEANGGTWADDRQQCY
jgi:hypothetical protein